MVSCVDTALKCYKNRKVLITGHTGFKGSWLAKWLLILGADVCGCSLAPETRPSLFEILNLKSQIEHNECDIRDFDNLQKVFNKFKPEIVFHLAAQPIVSVSYEKPLDTYETNVIGTLKVMQAAKEAGSVKAFVNVTTDKCYENIEKNDYSYSEEDKLGGYDMYSSSKACSELLTSSFRQSFLRNGYALASARAGNVIGGGDWAQNRIIPDCVRAITNSSKVILRNPGSIRPWQFVLEPLRGYLMLGERLLNADNSYACAFNFGPDECRKVIDVTASFFKFYGEGEYITERSESFLESGVLMLDSSKAKKMLNRKPALSFEKMIEMTALWYKEYQNGADMEQFTTNQIKEYMEILDGKVLQNIN